MGQGDTLLNALIGAVISVILAFLPLSPALGGIAAGYLQKESRGAGLRVGAIAGAITMVPLFFVTMFGGTFFLSLLGLPPGAFFGFGLLIVFAAVFFVLYTVALSAVGGYLGAYIALETDIGTGRV